MDIMYGGASIPRGSDVAGTKGPAMTLDVIECEAPNPRFLELSGGTANKSFVVCPVTGCPCDGDLSHLCEDYGCGRKGGLSPHSDENI